MTCLRNDLLLLLSFRTLCHCTSNASVPQNSRQLSTFKSFSSAGSALLYTSTTKYTEDRAMMLSIFFFSFQNLNWEVKELSLSASHTVLCTPDQISCICKSLERSSNDIPGQPGEYVVTCDKGTTVRIKNAYYSFPLWGHWNLIRTIEQN